MPLQSLLSRTLSTSVAMAALCGACQPVAAIELGTTASSLAVSPSGEATFTAPLNLPPGTAGLVPKLALVYSHRGGDGSVGYGWSVGGLSAITRCAQTIVQDGVRREVVLDANDKYCLDGNRLRLTGGTYAVAGSTYQTEFETYARITALGSSGSPASGPASFVLEAKDGLIYEYGNTTDSRIESKGTAHVRLWALSKVRDRSGNAITLVYTEDSVNGSYRIDNIQYTSNPTLGVSAPYKVQFVYETRPVADVNVWYRSGGIIKIVTRLTSIKVQYGWQETRRYDLAYEPYLSSTARSRLASITECGHYEGSSSDVCYRPLQFTYTSASPGTWEGAVAGNAPGLANILPIDVNGDGHTDIVYSSSAVAGSGTWRILFGNNNGSFNAALDTGIVNSNFESAIPIDYNADGMTDVLVPGAGGTWWVMLGSASGLALPFDTGAPVASTAGNAIAMDVDGDGLEDLVWAQINAGGDDAVYARLRVSGGAFAASTTTLLAPLGAGTSILTPVWGRDLYRSRIRAPDFNADGRKDFIVQIKTPSNTQYAEAVLNVGAGVRSIYSNWGCCAMPFIAPADLNGDGLPDLVMQMGDGIAYSFNDGKSFTPMSAQIQIYPWDANKTAVIVDRDGDGKDDVAVRMNYAYALRWVVVRSTGEQLIFDPASYSGNPSNAQFAYASDVDGNGFGDATAVQPNGDVAPVATAAAPPDLIATVVDGSSNTSSVAYTTLAQGSYTRGSGAAFPLMDYQGPLSVVKYIGQPTGAGGAPFTMTYAYQGARWDLQGRGFAGFALTTVTDSRTGLQRKTWRRQDFPLTGAISQQSLYQPNGTTLISDVVNAYASAVDGAAPETRIRTWQSSRLAKRYELGGAYNGAQIDEALTATLVDAYGTVYDTTTVRTEKASGNGVQAGATYTERIVHTLGSLLNDTTNWCLGRPQFTEEIRSHSQWAGASVTRTTSRTWDGSKCRPTQEIAEPGNGQYQVTRDIGYDGFGNVNAETLTGINLAARSTTTSWSADGRFPVSTTNALGQVASSTWSGRMGLRLTDSDANGRTTTYSYTPNGLPVSVIGMDGTNAYTDRFDCRVSWAQQVYPQY